jgi:hypothetical protein
MALGRCRTQTVRKGATVHEIYLFFKVFDSIKGLNNCIIGLFENYIQIYNTWSKNEPIRLSPVPQPSAACILNIALPTRDGCDKF